MQFNHMIPGYTDSYSLNQFCDWTSWNLFGLASIGEGEEEEDWKCEDDIGSCYHNIVLGTKQLGQLGRNSPDDVTHVL